MTITHGLSSTPTYLIWKGMRQRCYTPTCVGYENYGGRGITICDRWSNYQLFLEDMGERPGPEFSIEREDNDGNYEPSNCVWATRTTQSRNRRAPRFLKRIKNDNPSRYIRCRDGRYTLEMCLRDGVRYSKNFATLQDAEDHRADIEYERMLYHTLLAE